jgi:hypothetical protein
MGCGVERMLIESAAEYHQWNLAKWRMKKQLKQNRSCVHEVIGLYLIVFRNLLEPGLSKDLLNNLQQVIRSCIQPAFLRMAIP